MQMTIFVPHLEVCLRWLLDAGRVCLTQQNGTGTGVFALFIALTMRLASLPQVLWSITPPPTGFTL
jgi:hypothetical protein